MNKIKFLMILSLLFCISKVLYASDESPYNEHTDNSTKITDPITETSNLLEAYVHLANLRNGGIDNIKNLYDNHNEKTLAYFSVSAFEVAGTSILIDLADYQSAMNNLEAVNVEGENEWVTIWIDFSLSKGLGLPFSAGLMTFKMEDGVHDPKRKLDISGLNASAPFVQVSLLEVKNGAYNAVDNNPNISLSAQLVGLNWNIARFEIKKEYLDAIIKNIIGDKGLIGQNLNENDIASIFSSFIERQFSLSGWMLIPDFSSLLDFNPLENIRRFTSLDTNEERNIDGEFYHARGGFDINDDGIPNNVFPITPYDDYDLSLNTEIEGIDFDLTFINSGTEVADFFIVIETENIPEGWSVSKKDRPPPGSLASGFNPHIAGFGEVPPTEFSNYITSEWLISANGIATKEATITFSLYRYRQYRDDEKLDEIEVTVRRHQDGNLFSPQLEFTAPEDPVTVLQGDPIDISWNVVDPNENSYVALAYDQSLSNNPWDLNQSEWILPGIKEDGGNSTYSWNTTDIPEGTYQIWGVVYDGATEPVYRTLQHHVTILEQVAPPQFTNGRVSPTVGSTNTKFEFSIDYQSDFGIEPDVVNLYVDNKTYRMSTNSTDFKGGVIYTVEVNNLTAGSHSYAFTAEKGSETISYTATDQVSVSEPAEGWDLSVSTALTGYMSPSSPDFNDNISITAKFKNDGNYLYEEVQVEAKLVTPSGDIEDTDKATLYSINSGAYKENTFELSMPSSGDGQYKIDIYANVELDEDRNNNSLTKSFGIGIVREGTDSYRAITDAIRYDVNDTFTITNENGSDYELLLKSVEDDGRVWVETMGDNLQYENFELGIYDDFDIALQTDMTYKGYSYTGEFEEYAYLFPLVSSSSVPIFSSNEIYLESGQQASTSFNIPSGYDFDDFEIYDDDNYMEKITSWISSIEHISGNQYKINWDTGNESEYRTYKFYLKLEYYDEYPTYNKLYVKISPPSPEISSLSSNEFSADDEITISGTNFGSEEGKVSFDGINGNVTSWSGTSITVVVPEGLSNGTLFVNSPAGGNSNTVSYTILSSTGDPIVQQKIPNQAMQAGDTLFVTQLSNTFSDPNGDELVYQIEISYSDLTYDQASLESGELVLSAGESSFGSHNVSVKATDADNASVTDEFIVAVVPNLAPDFTVDADSGSVPFTVQFTDQSEPSEIITSWQWDFNDDGLVDSDVQNPSYTFEESGSYTVKLKVSDGQNSKSEFKSDFITVEQPIDPVMSINADELPTEIDYQGGEFTVQIDNTGVGTLAWEAEPFEPWIQVEKIIQDETTGSGILNITIPPYDYCGDIDRFGLIDLISSNAANEYEVIEIYQKGIEYDHILYEDYIPLPDLIARSITAPITLMPGDSIGVNTIYGNVGDLIADSGWTGSIYLTTDNSTFDLYENNAIEVGSFTEQERICYKDPDFERVVPVTIPDTLSGGEYFLTLYVDSEDRIFEKEDRFGSYSTTNFVFTDTISISSTSPIVYEGSIDPITLRAGDTRNQVAETYLHENIASLFNGGSGTVSYTAASSDPTLIEAGIAEGNLSITAIGSVTDEEIVTVTVAGTDENENSAEGTIEVIAHPAYGDLNADGRVNSFDATRILQYKVESYSFNTLQQDIADIDQSATITSYDAALIKQYAVELIDQIPLSNSQAMIASSSLDASNRSGSDPVTWGEIQKDGQTLLLPVLLNVSSPVYSIDLSGTFEAKDGTLEEISFPTLPEGWSTFHRVDEDGDIRIAMAGTQPFDGAQIAILRFKLNEFSQHIGVEGKGYLNNSSYTMEQVAVQEVVDQFALDNNFPNPFNPSTTVRYQLPTISDVRIEMYNIAGQRVMQLVDESQNAGSYNVNVDMSAFSSGVYFIRFVAKSEQETYIKTSKMTLIK